MQQSARTMLNEAQLSMLSIDLLLPGMGYQTWINNPVFGLVWVFHRAISNEIIKP